MKSPRRNKALETLARSIKDSERFVTHVCNVAAAYGRHSAFDAAASRDVRQTLRAMAKHAEALSQWLQSAARHGGSIEGQALRQIGTATRNPGSFGQSLGLRGWLAQLAAASAAAAEAAPASAREDALRSAAEGLRATFEHHGLKLSQRAAQQKQSDAVRLLCAVVNGSGTELEPGEARQLFKAAKAAPAAEPVRAQRAASRERTRRRGK